MTDFRESVRRLFASASTNALAVGANQGAMVLVGLMVAHWQGREAFGRFSLLLVTMQAFASLGQLSLGITATKFIAEFRANAPQFIEHTVRMLTRVNAILACVIAALLLLFNGVINQRVFASSAALSEILLLAPIAAMQVVTGIQASAIAGFEAYGAQAKVAWAGAICTLIACPLLASQWGVAGALVGIGCGLLVRVLASSVIIVRQLHLLNVPAAPAAPRHVVSRIVAYAIPAALAGFTALPASWVAASALTSEPGGVHAYAAFAAAFSVKSLMLFVPAMITSVTVPRLSYELAVDQKREARRTYLTAVLASMAGLGVAAIVIIAGLDWVLAAYGSEFENGATVFRMVIISGVLEGMSICMYSLFQARGQLWLPLFAFSIPRDVILVSSAFVLCPNYGAVGLAGATLIAASYTILAVLATLAFRERGRVFRQAP